MSEEDKGAVLNRLRNAGGHLEAVILMVEEDKPCEQILHQLNAVQAALHKAGALIFAKQIENCTAIIADCPHADERANQAVRLAGLYRLLSRF